MSTNPEPIYSDLLQDEPELAELISQFIDALPDLIDAFASAIAQEDWIAVKKLVHDMKGLGGGYGYPHLSELAERMRVRILEEQYTHLDSDVDEMRLLARRIQIGYQA